MGKSGRNVVVVLLTALGVIAGIQWENNCFVADNVWAGLIGGGLAFFGS